MKNFLSFFIGITLASCLIVSSCKQKSAEEQMPPPAAQTPAGETEDTGKAPAIPKDKTEFLERLNGSLAGVADVVKPSVVNISTTKTIAVESPFDNLFNDPFFRRFFGDRNQPFGGGKRKYKTSALGSGVIVTEDGYILTNNHVVQNVDEIKVILNDKREFTGKLIGTDPKTDLAIVKVSAKGLPAIKIGDSNKLRVGELVIAIGNPFGLGNTITMGIVSAVGRSHVGIADYEDFIQTDAAINPGNSGGALINVRAELVGINTAIFSTTGGYMGIGFAVPSSMAQSIMNSIIKHGKVTRGYLGVTIQDLTPDIAEHFNIKNGKGALVTEVLKDSPAEKGGLKRGDLLLEFNGNPVEDSAGLRNMAANTLPGKTVNIKALREGKETVLTVTLSELIATAAEAAGKSEYANTMKGVHVQNLTDEIKKGLDIPRRVTGVIVSNVDEDSPAFEMLKQNDVIQEVNRKTVRSLKDYEDAVSRIKTNDNVLLLVYRSGGYIYVTLRS